MKLDHRTVLGLLEEAAAIGLLAAVRDSDLLEGKPDETGLNLTSAGKAVAFASAARRVDRNTADAVFEAVLDSAQRMNGDPRSPLKIDKIWVFGSMINPR